VKLGALDLGSNSFHLIVVDAVDHQTFTVIDRAKEMVRLGEGTLRARRIPAAGFQRGIQALRRLGKVAERHQPEAMLVVGTAALREAQNRGDFCRAAREAIGVEVRIADEHEEARLIYLGALPSLALGDRRVALFDLGGGSLEIIVGDARRVLFSASLKLGGLRLAEEWLRADPPSAVDLAALRDAVRAALAPVVATMNQIGFDFVAFCAGTAKSLRAMSARGGSKPSGIGLGDLLAWEKLLTACTTAERLEIAGLHPRRADSIVAGTVVLRTALELTGHDHATFCRSALREGIIRDDLARRAGAADVRTSAPEPIEAVGVAKKLSLREVAGPLAALVTTEPSGD
jgi:exopolyphosphatase/guanosine-5'-triphosphate,3'-diphosphate pyrophosphatase